VDKNSKNNSQLKNQQQMLIHGVDQRQVEDQKYQSLL
jgi:hypothetical protein